MKLSDYKKATKELREFSESVSNRRYEFDLRTIRGLFHQLKHNKAVQKAEYVFETALEVVKGLKDGSIFRGEFDENLRDIFIKYRLQYPAPHLLEGGIQGGNISKWNIDGEPIVNPKDSIFLNRHLFKWDMKIEDERAHNERRRNYRPILTDSQKDMIKRVLNEEK